jgi:hypothetical protein
MTEKLKADDEFTVENLRSNRLNSEVFEFVKEAEVLEELHEFDLEIDEIKGPESIKPIKPNKPKKSKVSSPGKIKWIVRPEEAKIKKEPDYTGLCSEKNNRFGNNFCTDLDLNLPEKGAVRKFRFIRKTKFFLILQCKKCGGLQDVRIRESGLTAAGPSVAFPEKEKISFLDRFPITDKLEKKK